MLKGKLDRQMYTLANVYFPNIGTTDILDSCFTILKDFTEGTLVLGGDLNVAPELLLDVSRGTSYMKYSYLNRFTKLLSKLMSWNPLLHSQFGKYINVM